MKSSKRVVVIDTIKRKIYESEVSSLEEMQKLVGGHIECATILENGDEVYVNEEGLFTGDPQFFSIKGGHQPYAGNAYVIGSVTSAGNNRAAESTVAEIQHSVKWGMR